MLRRMVPARMAGLVSCAAWGVIGLGWGWQTPTWAAAPEEPSESRPGAHVEPPERPHGDPEHPHGDPERQHGDPEHGYERLLEEVVGATVVYPQDKGEIQLTLEPSYVRRRDGHLGSITHDVEIGATDWLQFELAWTAPVIRGGGGGSTAAGIGGVEIGTQLTWMRMRGSPFSGAIAFEATVPVGRDSTEFDEGHEGQVEYEPFITFAVDPPAGRAQVFTNVGAEISAEEAQPFVNVGVIGAASLTRPHLVVSYAPPQAYVVPGVSIVLPAGWQLIAGISVGVSRESDPWGVGLLLVYELNPLERRSR